MSDVTRLFLQACSHNMFKLVKKLLELPEVDPSAYDNHAIRWASENGHLKVVKLLLNTPNRGIDPLFYYIGDVCGQK